MALLFDGYSGVSMSAEDRALFTQLYAEMSKLELFVLDNALVRAMDIDEGNHTLDVLRELDLAAPPFSKFCIDMNLRAYVARSVKEDDDVGTFETMRVFVDYDPSRRAQGSQYRMVCLGRLEDGDYHPMLLAPDAKHPMYEAPFDAMWFAVNTLIISLATRNVVKNKRGGINLSKHHPAKGHPHYTTLSLPPLNQLESDSEHPPREGTSPQPHLRRAHIRNQPYGPRDNPQYKPILIQALIVNADKDFVSQRKAYFVGGPT